MASPCVPIAFMINIPLHNIVEKTERGQWAQGKPSCSPCHWAPFFILFFATEQGSFRTSSHWEMTYYWNQCLGFTRLCLFHRIQLTLNSHLCFSSSRQWVLWIKMTLTMVSISTTVWLLKLLTTPTSLSGTTKVSNGPGTICAFLLLRRDILSYKTTHTVPSFQVS